MDGIAIVVARLEDLSEDQIVQWLQPLYPEKIGAVPVFECAGISDLQVMLSLFDPGSLILANPELAELYFSPSLIKDLSYSSRIVYVNGVERRILVVPAPKAVDWALMEPALDRFEEIL